MARIKVIFRNGCCGAIREEVLSIDDASLDYRSIVMALRIQSGETVRELISSELLPEEDDLDGKADVR